MGVRFQEGLLFQAQGSQASGASFSDAGDLAALVDAEDTSVCNSSLDLRYKLIQSDTKGYNVIQRDTKWNNCNKKISIGNHSGKHKEPTGAGGAFCCVAFEDFELTPKGETQTADKHR